MAEPKDNPDQGTLLNLETKEISAYWVDPKQPLQVPANPLHYAAHRYQLILARLDIQAARNPAQFNSGNYIQIMEKLEKLWEKINGGSSENNQADDAGAMGAVSQGAPAAVGAGASARVGDGISPQNPFSR